MFKSNCPANCKFLNICTKEAYCLKCIHTLGPLKTTLNYYKNLYEKCIYDWHSLLVLWSRISSSKSCYTICLHTLLIIVYIQTYLILIHRVQSCTLYIVYFIKQAGLTVNKRKAFDDYTLLCPFAAFIFQHFVYLFTRIHLSSLRNEHYHYFSTKLIFHHP